MQQISPSVYVETKRKGANTTFVTTAEGIVMIDTPHRPSDALRWRDEITRRGELRYAINTEHHIDHITGNYYFPTTIICHEETKKAIVQFPEERIKSRMKEIDPKEMPLMENYHKRVPSVTFSERLNLYLGDYTFELIHLGGHTAGQIAVYLPKQRIVFTGDTISCKVQIFMHEADPFKWLKAIQKIDALEVDAIVPGHGEVCDKSTLPELSAFIQDWIDAINNAIARGLTKEEAMNQISFLDRYPMAVDQEAMGPSVQRNNVAHLYDLLSKKKK